MKKAVRYFVIAIVSFCFLIGTASEGKKPRKLPVSAYIKSAKIEIVSGDPERYLTAAAMLDSLFMNYGHHAEGLFLMSQMMVDGIETSSGPIAKTPYVGMMVAYIDSLHMCCENKDIKKKYRKNCDKFIQQMDSIAVKYWREFYNAGVEQLGEMNGFLEDLKTISDSSMKAYLENGLKSNFDSSLINLQLAITINPTDDRSFIGVATAYERIDNFENAIEWKRKALELSGDSASLLLSIGYNYINMDKFCEAIPYLKAIVDGAPDDLTNMYNLTICYNNCGMYDSAMVFYDKILKLDTNNIDVLSAVGRYYNEMGRQAADSTKNYEQTDNTKLAKEWRARKDESFDSSRVYFKRAFVINPEDEFIADMYGIICAIDGEFEEAVVAFKKLTEINPDNIEYWTSLGDCYLNLKNFDESIIAYEKVVELDPSNRQVWQQLMDLYHEKGNTAKETEAKKHLDQLN